MKLPVVSVEGKELRTLEVDDSVFGITPNAAVLHQAYVRQRNNQRAGTVKTRTRGEVQGSTRKIRMQKYTGRARQGSNRSPTRVGGGIVFGPRPRDYSQDMPKKMRRLAIRSALSGKVADGQLVVIDQLAFEKPQTRELVRILGNVGLDRSALVVTTSTDDGVLASVRNLPRVRSLNAAYLNVGDMLNHAGLLMTEEAVRTAESLWGKRETAKPAKTKASPEAAAPEAAAPEVAPAAAPPKRRAASTKAVKAETAEETPAKPNRASKASVSATAEKPKTVAKKKTGAAKGSPASKAKRTTKKAEGD
jgi:large subunit ribosomal protein L4